MKVLIVENDPFVVLDIKENLKSLGYQNTKDTDTVEKAMECLDEDKPDIVLVDIELNSEKSGIELGGILQKRGIPFIYLSDIQDLKTFEAAKATNPQANLPKPVLPLHLRNALLEIDFNPNKTNTSPFIMVNDQGRKTKVNKDQIIYLKAARNNCDLFHKVKRYTSSTPMNFVFKTLDQNLFIQVHRSYVINIAEVASCRGNEIFLKNSEDIIPLSDSYRANFNKQFDLV